MARRRGGDWLLGHPALGGCSIGLGRLAGLVSRQLCALRGLGACVQSSVIFRERHNGRNRPSTIRTHRKAARPSRSHGALWHPVTEIARTIGVSKPTLLKYFRDELDTGATKANAQVGEFIFSTILGVPIPGRPPVTDERARATLAIFWAKTRMHWKETNLHEHSGKQGDPIEVSTVRERITRRLARLAAESTTSEDTEESE